MLMPLLGILTVLATITALKLARELMLPIVVALLLSLIMSPVVRALRRRRIPEHLGAAVVVFGTVALAAGAAFAVAGPASDFFAKAPETLAAAQQRLQAIARPLEAFQRTAERVEAATTTASTSPIRARVEIAPEGFLARWSGGTLTALVSAFSAVFLTYFLLASGPMFRKKIADALPSRFERARFASLFDEIELVTSRFLGLSLMINAGVAVATAIALVIAVGFLERERRLGRMPRWTTALLAAPLLVPQIAFLFGMQVALVRLRLDGTGLAVVWAHLVFVLPYVFLALADPWRALDPRLLRTAACLGASPWRVLMRVKLPLLLRPLLAASASGFAVSSGLYLPTLFAGAGRWTTLTTEAVTLSSGADRRILAATAVLQAALPLCVFAVSVAWPSWRERRRRALAIAT